MRLATWLFLGLVTAGLTGGFLLAADEYDPVIDPADFEDAQGKPLPIDNPFHALTPGTTFVYEGEGEDGVEHIEVYVSKKKKQILGVRCTVVEDRVWLLDEETAEWELIEETFDWFAQDSAGNVWYFGEDSMALDDEGDWVPDGAWEAGVDGAKPGIVMLADPQVGVSYRQEYYEGEAEDMGKVLQLNASVSVEYGDFEDCLKTKDWTPLEPGEVENKYYVAGLGKVLEVGISGGPTEEFELIEVIEN